MSVFAFNTDDKLTICNKVELINKYNRQKREVKRISKTEYERDLQQYKLNGGQIYKNVIIPEYQYDATLKGYREVKQPPQSIYMGLGWDENPPDQKRKHYRKFYPKELESVKIIMPKKSPFASYDIFRGQTRGASQNWW